MDEDLNLRFLALIRGFLSKDITARDFHASFRHLRQERFELDDRREQTDPVLVDLRRQMARTSQDYSDYVLDDEQYRKAGKAITQKILRRTHYFDNKPFFDLISDLWFLLDDWLRDLGSGKFADGDEETELLQSVKRIWDYYQPAASRAFLVSPEDRFDG